jgi:hypothetical protein
MGDGVVDFVSIKKTKKKERKPKRKAQVEKVEYDPKARHDFVTGKQR